MLAAKLFTRSALFTLVATLLGATMPQAGTIELDGFSGSETVVTFTAQVVPLGPAPITIGGLTIDSSVASLRIDNLTTVLSETPLASGGHGLSDDTVTISNIDFTLATPTNRFGLWINGGNAATSYTISAYDAGDNFVGSQVFLFSLFNGFPDPSTFAGIEFATGFTRVNVLETTQNGQFTSIDDIRYETAAPVPEPAAAFGLGLGLLGLSYLRGRRAA